MSDPDKTSLDHEGAPEPGFYLLFTDGNKNPDGAPMIGGLLKYRTRSRRWEPLRDGSFSKQAKGDSIDEWEYEALIEGLKLAKDRHAKYVWAYMDRRAIVEQVNDPEWKIRPDLRPHRDEVRKLGDGFTVFRLSWMPREMNREADDLARSQGDSGTWR